MKKKIGIVAASIVVALTAFAAVNGSWIKVSDPCNKCVIETVTRKCGVCGGFMNGSNGEKKGSYLYYDFTCNKCNHTARFKIRY